MLGNESIHFNINYPELEGLLPNNIRKHVAISSKGMKITFPNNSNNTFIIIVCGHNTSGCGIAYIMCSIEEMKSIVLGKNPILNIKRKITGNNIELYFFHSGCYLTVDILRNHTNYLPVYSIINSADEIPSDAENVEIEQL